MLASNWDFLAPFEFIFGKRSSQSNDAVHAHNNFDSARRICPMRRRFVSSDVALRSANAYRKNVFKFEGKERRGGRGESGRILITSSISQTEVAKKKRPRV